MAENNGTELAKAYVQIIPSAEGIGKGIAKVMDSEGDHAGRRFGDALTIAAGDMLSKGASALIGGVMDSFNSAMGEGGALEQSIGGVETLFGDAFEVVKANADAAFATAGMSANQYMELATSFSASLLQSLDGDTQAAASIADMAMRDMSDNANKMGTDLEMLKNAYQGFSRSNFTMLDNLKLGYGGTKEEMERLLEDAEKLSGQKYDIGSLSDMYEAIHVVQQELGITGTTASEAATTLQGSAAAMSASWKNLLGNMALGEDLQPSLTALAETTSTWLFDNFLPMAANVIGGLPSVIGSVVSTGAPLIVDGFLGFIPTLATGVTERLPEIAATAMTAVGGFANSVVEQLPGLVSRGGELVGSLIAGAGENLPGMISAGGEMILGFVSGVIQRAPDLLAAGFDAVVSIIGGIGEAGPDLVRAAGDLLGAARDAISEIDWIGLGADIINGLIEGLLRTGSALFDAMKGLAQSAFSAVTGVFDIHSPSRKMGWVAEMNVEGYVNSLRQGYGKVEEAMNEFGWRGMDALERAMRSPAPQVYEPQAKAQIVQNNTWHINAEQSPAEQSREAEDMLRRLEWKVP